MTSAILQDNNIEISSKHQFVELSQFLYHLKNGIWIFGILAWLFGAIDRGISSLLDNYVSPLELFHIFAVSFLFIAWLALKPEKSLSSEIVNVLQNEDYEAKEVHFSYMSYFHPIKERMMELSGQHMISQSHILPFPYFCQIYHLLNLKHLETIHSFSLNNLRVIGVNEFSTTEIGGSVKFQTVLESPKNALRIWRQPVVEASLTLLTPYTVELQVPVYNGKQIIVMFNVIPLGRQTHKLVIDIFTDLNWPKPLLQALLHVASCLTLFEDLPYLGKLAETKIERLFQSHKISDHETMWLFKRFVDLYGSKINPSKPRKSLAVEAT